MKSARDHTRHALSELLAGRPPNGVHPDACGQFADVVREAYGAHESGGTDQARRYIDIAAKANPDLAKLIASDPERFELHWLKEAMQPQEPDKYVIDRIFLEGSLNQIVGEPGSKKTYVLLDAALAVASGSTWLGRCTEKGPVLIIDEESGRRRLERRIGAIARARHVATDTPLAYVSLAQFDARNADDVKEVRRLIEQIGATFVVIDAMVDIMPGADENAVQDVQPVMMNLRKIAEETRAAIALIHHTNRGGSYRGSSAISGAVDLMLKVESKQGTPHIEITTEKTRDVEPFAMAGHIRFEDEKVFLNPADPKHESSLNAGEEYVMRYLRENGASSKKDITDHADTCSEGTAKNGIYSLARSGLIERVDNGGRGDEAIYDIAHPITGANDN